MLTMSKKRTGSRHKPRKTVTLSPLLYGQLAKLARKNQRPIAWQIRLILVEGLRHEGLWPVPGFPDDFDDEPD